MQRVDVGERGGMVTLEVGVGDRNVTVILSPLEAEVVERKIRAARAKAERAKVLPCLDVEVDP
jgi:hypothetical protein